MIARGLRGGGVSAWCALAATLLAAPALATAQPPVSSSGASVEAGVPVSRSAGTRVDLKGVGGSPRFALVGRRVEVQGLLTPFVAGQTVAVSFYLDRRKVAVRVAAILPTATGAGRFKVEFTSHEGGLVVARADHYATAAQPAFSVRTPSFRFVNPNIGPGARGQSVRLLQAELDALHYAVPLSGVFDEGTARALIAYRKITGLERVPAAGRGVFTRLARRAGSFHVRYPGDGRHVEANLTTQVLAEIDPAGRVYRIYTISSGKPSTPTVIGRFRVYLKTPGENSEGMVDSNYFIRGYAIHGYAEVPTYAASHGCLRVPIPDAPAIYAWVRDGTPVDVYTDDGAGSTRVRADAGP
jgi:peptidoglycan hydrolase-like protein with peptidoglycan-binding domain